MTQRISQADIAKHVGVSASTVSRALHNDPRITAAVRKKVIHAAQELGYRPDPSVSALANYRWKSRPQSFTGTVAWITVGDSPQELRRQYPEFNLYWEGAAACANRFGYRIEEFCISDRMPLEKLEQILYARNVTGVLLPPEIHPYKKWEKLHSGNYSIVRLSRSVHNLNAHLVTTNQTADGLLAAKEMFDLGYRRIGFVGSLHEDRLFYPGFAWGQRNQPAAEHIPPLFLYDVPEDHRVEQFKQWFKTHRPDAILEDMQGFYDLLAEAGIRIPDDIPVATQNALRNPNTAGIMQNLEEVGRVSMLLLISLISDHDRGIPPIARQVLVKGNWINGSTLPRRREKA